MAINFPSSGLTVGQTFQQADRAWEWDGEKWKATGTTSTNAIGASVTFEGATDDAYETTLTVIDPTADRTITLKNADGTVAFTSDIPTVAGVYAPLADPTLTGTPAAPTAAANTNTTQVATTAFVMTEVGDYAPLASPALTGNPTAPTQSASNNSTRIATTAYVDASGGSSDEIVDADSDTKIQVEESADEDKIRFDTGGTERAVLDSSGLEIKSGGLKLDNLDSSNVNTLDDYEEGTFTGSFTCQNGTITVKTGYNTGGYTKIGRVVHIQFSPAVDSFSGNSGELYVEGLPFTSMPAGASTSLTYARIPVTVTNLNADVGGGASGQIPHNMTQCSVSSSDCQSGHEPIGGAVKAWTEVCIQGHYFVDS